MRIRALAALLLAIGIVLAAPDAQAEPAASTPSVLASLRKAMLARPLSSLISMHTAGTVELAGIRGRGQEWIDVRGGRFIVSQSAGALSGSSGWDGKTAWSQDYAGLVTVDGGQAGRLQSIDQAYLDGLRYLRPDAGGATVVYAGRQSENGTPYDVLAVTPPNGTEIRLWIDPQTHLIARQTTVIGTMTWVTTLSSYRRVDGLTYPFMTRTQLSNGNGFSQRVSTLEVNAEIAERMRLPAESVHDFSIAGATITSFPIQIVNNHVYLTNVTIERHGPYTFVLDSGGDYIITPDVAAALSAKSSGALRLQGVGSSTEGAAFARVGTIAVGSAIVRNQYALVLPIATGFGVAEGMRIDGMLGYQFPARYVTTIDYANSKLTLAMPSAPPAAAPGAAPMQFFLDGTIPRINVNVGDVTVSAEVDTGSRTGL
ncbi:MAG: retropepsin-like domain-containing protein, partial [Candidatus Eremiobacteraeota bacterium]|nr:retropepsin-like domain-containing protein [Candidatus Eremiobacteraeota bacterium]